MSHRKRGLRALGLAFVAALAFSAFAASAAQAGKWFVSSAVLGHPPIFKNILGSGGEGRLLSVGLNIECLGLTFTGKIENLTKGLATITFVGCAFMEGSPLTLSAVCNINAADGKTGAGKITASVKFTAILHEKESWILFEPDNESGTLNERTFTTVNIVDSEEGSEECVLAGPKEIKGTQVALILNPGVEALKHEIHVITDTVRKALWAGDFLHIGANLVTLDTTSASIDLENDPVWSFR